MVILTLNVLCNGARFRQGGYDWQRSRSTINEYFHLVCGVIVEHMYDLYVKFPTVDDARRSM